MFSGVLVFGKKVLRSSMAQNGSFCVIAANLDACDLRNVDRYKMLLRDCNQLQGSRMTDSVGTTVNSKREGVIQACMRWGGSLVLPANLDGRKLLWALSGCESSFGFDCTPRHEPYYHRLANTKPVVNPRLVDLTEKFGCAAHSSFGPWQLLFVNAPDGTLPTDFDDIEEAADLTVRFINQRILVGEKAKTLAAIAAAYNSGRWQQKTYPPGVERYLQDCQRYYLEGLPAPYGEVAHV